MTSRSTTRRTGTADALPASHARPPYLGFGLGLRPQHYSDILSGAPRVDWFEAISENYMVPGGQPLRMLDRIRERYPIVLHGVSMSIASTAPFDEGYLTGLRELARRVEPVFVSDHLCWTGVHGVNLHDLLPVPYTREALDHVAARVHHVQEALGRPLVLENVSSYIELGEPELPEWEFIAELSRRTGCWLLLDINNVFVAAFNHEYDAKTYIDAIPADRVVQFHLAGHEHAMTHIVDTHDALICDEVWALYRYAIDRFGPVSTLIERDDHIPPYADMVSELARAREIARELIPGLPHPASSPMLAA